MPRRRLATSMPHTSRLHRRLHLLLIFVLLAQTLAPFSVAAHGPIETSNATAALATAALVAQSAPNSSGWDSYSAGFEDQTLSAAPGQPLQFRVGEQLLSLTPSHAYFIGGQQMLGIEFVGASGAAPTGEAAIGTPEGEPTLSAAAPYLGQATYSQLWPGVSLSYEQVDGNAKSTYTLAPGVAVDTIRLRYNHPLSLQADGSLQIAFPDKQGTLSESAPIAWQELPTGRVAVEVRFQLSHERLLGFAVGSYDKSQPLVIDPIYRWHRVGGSNSIYRALVTESDGSVYTFMQAASGSYTRQLVKYDPAGQLVWQVPLPIPNQPMVMQRDAAGNFYMLGVSGTWNGPNNEPPLNALTGSTEGFFVLKLDPAGNYLWHTIHGAGANYVPNAEYLDLSVTPSGEIVVGAISRDNWVGPGNTAPLNPHSPETCNNQALLRLNTAGVYQWHTFYGTCQIGQYNFVRQEALAGVNFDSAGNMYLVGTSQLPWVGPGNTAPLQAHTGGSSISVTKLAPDGTYQWHSFYGDATAYTTARDVAIDATGKLYIVGTAPLFGTPIDYNPTPGYESNPRQLVITIDSNGTYLWHHFFGEANFGRGISLANGGLYIVGYYGPGMYGGTGGNSSDQLPFAPPDPSQVQYGQAYIMKLTTDGAYSWHTFLPHNRSGGSDALVAISAGGKNVHVTLFSGGNPYDIQPLPDAAVGNAVLYRYYDGPGFQIVPIGMGSITANPAGSSCTSVCAVTYPTTTTVTLQATGTPTSTFFGWGDRACSSNGSNPTCTLEVSGPLIVKPIFRYNSSSTLTNAPATLVTGQYFAATYTVNNVIAPRPYSYPQNLFTPTGPISITSSIGTTCDGNAPTLMCGMVSPVAGTVVLTGTYVGNTDLTPNSKVISRVVGRANTAVTISGPAPAATVSGEPITVTYSLAVVAPGSGTPTGSVTLSGSGISATCPISGTTGSCSVAPLQAGNTTLTLRYNGDANYNASEATTPRTVTKADTTTTISATPAGLSTPYEPITLRLTPLGKAPGGGIADGQITLTDNIGNTCTVASNSTCVITPTQFVGLIFTATYPGSANYNPSQAQLSHVVGRPGALPSYIRIISNTPASSVIGQAVRVSYAVTSTDTVSPDSTVTVIDGEGNSCTATVAAGNCTLSLTNVGSKSMYGIYSGDVGHNPAISARFVQTVSKSEVQVTVVGTTPEPSIIGRDPMRVYYSVLAKVPGSGTPTGVVTVTDSDGNTCNSTVATGFCVLPFSPARDELVGLKTITASYAGDQRYNAASGSAEHSVVDLPPSGLSMQADNPAYISPTVNFTVTLAAGTNVSYFWDFGDGRTMTSTLKTVSHRYYRTQPYTVTVTALNPSGEISSNQVITLLDRPISGFTAASRTPDGLVSRVIDFTSRIDNGTHVEYLWDFGDGTPLTVTSNALTNHVFTAIGTYTVKVTARNKSNSVTSSFSQIVRSPVTGLQAGGLLKPFSDETAIYTATVDDGREVTYSWDFGDGSAPVVSNGQVTHIFNKGAVYFVTVTASNRSSEQSQRLRVEVSDRKIVGLNATTDAPSRIDTSTYLAANVKSGTNVVYTWNFGDGTPPVVSTPALNEQSEVFHTYNPPLGLTASKLYTATVIAGNNTSRVSTSIPIIVYPERQHRIVATLSIYADRFIGQGNGTIRAVGNVEIQDWKNLYGRYENEDASVLLIGTYASLTYNLGQDTLALNGLLYIQGSSNIKQVGMVQMKGKISTHSLQTVNFQAPQDFQLQGYTLQGMRLEGIELPSNEGYYVRISNGWKIWGTAVSLPIGAPEFSLSVPTRRWSQSANADCTLEVCQPTTIDFLPGMMTLAGIQIQLDPAQMGLDKGIIRVKRAKLALPYELSPTDINAPSSRDNYIDLRLAPDSIIFELNEYGRTIDTGSTEIDHPRFRLLRTDGGYIIVLFSKEISSKVFGNLACEQPEGTPSFYCASGYLNPQGHYTYSTEKFEVNIGTLTLTLDHPNFLPQGITAKRGTICRSPEGFCKEWLDIHIGNTGQVTVNGSTTIALPSIESANGGLISNITASLTITGFPPRFNATNQQADTSFPNRLNVPTRHINFPDGEAIGSSQEEEPIPLGDEVISIAFFDLTLYKPVLNKDGTTYAALGLIAVAPQFSNTLGAVSAPVYGITIDQDGLIVLSKEFSLPEIKVGGFKLVDLGGKIIRNDKTGDEAGYDFSATGGFQFENVKGKEKNSPCSGLGVEATFTANARRDGGMIVVDTPKFKGAKLSVYCSIPIGQTGFAISKVSGSFELTDESFKVSVGLTVESKGDLSPPALELEASVGVQISPFELSMEGSAKVFAFQVAKLKARLWSSGFSTELRVSAVIIEGTFRIAVWNDASGFNMAASAKVSVVIRKGSILSLPWPAPDLPPSNFELGNVAIDLGRFTNNRWGFKGVVNLSFLGEYGLYLDNSGDTSFGDVDNYVLKTPPAAAGAPTFAQTASLRFAAFQAVSALKPLTAGTTVTRIATLSNADQAVFALGGEGDSLALTLRSPGGALITPSNLPSNVSYMRTVDYALPNLARAAAGQARLRVVNALVSGQAVDVRINGLPTVATLAAGAITDYGSFSAGNTSVEVLDTTSGALLASGSYMLNGAGNSTLALTSQSGSAALTLIGEDLPRLPSDAVLLRLVNLAPMTSTLGLHYQNGLRLVKQVAFQQASDYVSSSAGWQPLDLRDSATLDPFAALADATLANGQAYSVFALPGGQVVLVSDSALAPRLRVVNATPSRAAVDVYLTRGGSETLLVGNVAYGSLSDYAFAAGATLARITPAGTPGTTLASTALNLADQSTTTLAIAPSSGGPTTLLLADDQTVPTSGQIGLRVVNLGTTGNIDAQRAEDLLPLATAVDANASSTYATLPGGTYTVQLTGSAAQLLGTQPATTLRDGQSYTLFAIDGAAGLEGTLATDLTTLKKTSEYYAIKNPQYGDWSLDVAGVQPGIEYGLTAIGTVPPPQLQSFSATQSGTQLDAQWALGNAPPTTRVSLHVNSGDISHTQVVTDENGIASTEVITDYAGPALFRERTLTETVSLGGGYAATGDLSELPSGTYRAWLSLDDGRNTPIKIYATQPVVVAPRSWSPDWSATITPIAGLQRVGLRWDAHPDPDVNAYTVIASGPTISGTSVISIGNGFEASFAGLRPGGSYTFILQAYNPVNGQTTSAPPITVVPLGAPLSLSAPGGADWTIIPGGTQAATFKLSTTLDSYPQAAYISALAPRGLLVQLPQRFVTPTIGGADVPLVITATGALIPGTYEVPITAQGIGDTSTITATVIVPGYSLDVTLAGTSGGSVTSYPGGIACGITCSATLAYGTAVVLTAAAEQGSTFMGWGGACSGTGATCALTLTQAAQVTANFAPEIGELLVISAGSATGTVTSAESGISCGADCTTTLSPGSAVTLTAEPASGAVFQSWSGACVGDTITCTLELYGTQVVTATFTPPPTLLTAEKSGTGSGRVSSEASSLICDTDCTSASVYVDKGATVTLLAAPQLGSYFAGWSGACTDQTASCTVTVSEAKLVTATFNSGGKLYLPMIRKQEPAAVSVHGQGKTSVLRWSML